MVVGFFLFTLRDGHGWGGDFAQYINHAKNISMFRHYADTGYVYNTANPALGPRAYPPIFPLSLSLTYKVFGLNLTAFKIQLVFVFAVFLWVTARLFSSSLSESYILVYLIVMGFCPIFWAEKDTIASEHLFILLWYLTILVADQWYRHGKVFHSEWVHAFGLGLLIYLTYGTRTVGIVLLPSVVLCEFFVSRRLTRFGVCAIGMASGLILLEKIILPASGAGYLEQLSRLDCHRIAANIHADVVSFSTIWENGYSEGVRKTAGAILSLVGIIGFCRGNLPRPSFLGVSMVLYLGLVVLWPSAAWLRMVLPLLPAYLFYVLLGMDLPTIPAKVRRCVLACFCLFSIASYVGWYSQADYGAIDGVETRSAVELFQFVRENTQDDELCLFFKPRVLCLYTGRRATVYPSNFNNRDTWEYAKSTGVSVVIVRCNPETGGRWNSIYRGEVEMAGRTTELVEIWRNDDFRVFRGPCTFDTH
ncbi:MAG: hypothetical protein JXM70_29115 [Pirellulales bacterium]|nr:hypothetical protein [Pirellulales bacterium]